MIFAQTEMSWLGLHAVDWVVLLAYLLAVTAIGAWSYKKVKDPSDFFMGGRRFGKIFMMFFAFGAGTSSEQAVTVAAGSFRFGLAGIWYQFLWLWATPFYWIIAPLFRRMRALTTSDFFQIRYDTSTATLYSLLGTVMSITFIAGALYGAGAMIEGLAGGVNPATGEPYFPASYAIGGMTVMFLLYGLAGGLGAAVITDFIQGVLTIIFSFLLLPFVLSVAAEVAGTGEGVMAGFTALQQGIPGRPGEQLLSLTVTQQVAERIGKEPIGIFYVVMLSLSGLIGIVVQPHIMGVCGAGKTEMEGRFGFTFGNFLKRFCTIAWTFTGLACVIVYMTPGSPYLEAYEAEALLTDESAMQTFSDQVFGRAAHDILPTISHGLVGLLMAALLAAVMSTCDAQMVVGSGLFTENVYRRFVYRDGSHAHYVWVGRLASLVIVALALLMLTQFKNVIQVLTGYIQPIPTFMGLAFWFGIVWRGFTPAAVWASTVTAALGWYLLHTHTPFETIAALGEAPWLERNIDYLPGLVREQLAQVAPGAVIPQKNAEGAIVGYNTSIPYKYLLYLSSAAVVGLVVSLLTRRPPAEKLDHFYRLIRTPVRPGEKVDTPCTLPDDHLPTETGKLIPVRDVEIPKPTAVGLGGFAAAWAVVGLLIWLTVWLAGLGG